MARSTRTEGRTHQLQPGDEAPQSARCTRTNIVLNDALIEQARELTGLQAKREIVEEALRTFVRVQRQRQGLALFGKLPWDGNLQEIRQGRGLAVGD